MICIGGVLVGGLVHKSEAQSPVNASDRADLSANAEVVRLTGELTQLSELAERDGRRDGPSKEVEDEDDDDDDGDDDLDFEQMAARDRAIALGRAKELTAAADREGVDMEWAPAMEEQITEGLAANGPRGVRLISAVCMSTICIVEIEHPQGEDGRAHVNWPVVFGVSRGFLVHHEPEPGVGARTLLYLARPGHALPPTAAPVE
ncbi:hypothetical protein DB30_03161 [Enhygromyxa salina]|uniref:Uncharacterized protein n=1 Tax=Enhygromyxa salina TaxID=215803 RepID=A0A0C2D727_9BACT|nr:hypothetical protein DB30_03161 [Enhygromyxa salina]